MHKKINVLISSAGTGAAWHIVNTAVKIFPDMFHIVAVDINPNYLIPASKVAASFYQVPLIGKPEYLVVMREILVNEKIDYFIPIIDQELYNFTTDDSWLATHQIHALTVSSKTASLLSDKRVMYDCLSTNQIQIPMIIHEKVTKKGTYFVKPYNGHGSQEARQISSSELSHFLSKPKYIIQEFCSGPEITIEVYNFKKIVKTICRERLETKSGVCTKTRVFFDQELDELARKLCDLIDLPRAFCFQVMKNQSNQWVVTDINPRLGAGTSMSSSYGFDLTAALLASLTKVVDPVKYLKRINKPTYIVRVYQDIVMT
jgi:predicted ATP-grasp superfamily ATP-dependent carboligase